jgi:hypothetical protein
MPFHSALSKAKKSLRLNDEVRFIGSWMARAGDGEIRRP